jgi:hypothetical protein
VKAYVYAILVDGIVRYIGKGSGDRMRYHLKIVRSIVRRRAAGEAVSTTKFYNRLAKSWRAGADIQMHVIADGLTDQEAFDREVVEIASANGLWNEAPGGHGFSAEQWADPAFQAKMRKREESKRTPEYRACRSEIANNQWANKNVMTALVWNDVRRAKVEALKRARLEERRKHAEEKLKRWAPYSSYNEYQKAKAAERRAANPRPGYHANAGSFTSKRATIVSLHDWKRNRSKRLGRIKRNPITGRFA